jgi:transposase
MMSRRRKNDPARFKTKVLIATLREDTPISELAVHFGIHSTVIHRWKKTSGCFDGGWLFW